MISLELPVLKDDIDGAFLAGLAAAIAGEWAVYWTVDDHTQYLKTAAVWMAPRMAELKLHETTRDRRLTMSEGMPGHTWKRKVPHLSNDLVRDMSLPRSLAATDAGLCVGLWFPILVDGEVWSVIEVLGVAFTAPDLLVELVRTFGDTLGRQFHQKHAHRPR